MQYRYCHHPIGRGALQRTKSATLDPWSSSKGASDDEDLPVNQFSNGKHVGRVVGLWRYPVKSMAPEALEHVDVSWFGLSGDRRWAFVRNDTNRNGFPWLTIRERNDMNHYHPSFVEPDQPDTSPTVVRTPSGDVLDVADPNLSSELYPNGARVMKQSRGVYDTFPLSLITSQTIAKLGELTETQLTPQRFRPNFLIEATEDTPFLEDTWVGSVLRIGNLRMRVDKRDGRCVVITIDPVTTKRNPEILRTVASERQGCAGVYGTTVEPGEVALNDNVVLETVG